MLRRTFLKIAAAAAIAIVSHQPGRLEDVTAVIDEDAIEYVTVSITRRTNWDTVHNLSEIPMDKRADALANALSQAREDPRDGQSREYVTEEEAIELSRHSEQLTTNANRHYFHPQQGQRP